MCVFWFGVVCCSPQIKSNVNREARTTHRGIFLFLLVLISVLILCQLQSFSVGAKQYLDVSGCKIIALNRT